ncbi:transposase [Rhodovastum atsumiense]|uniref:Transposase n=1 Tax=Rhodovastum atsumiense TaxID=504468 RepID=A0A5M6INF2_9PROT|nr:transposase [Rhodovastum atsumiense]KAA5609439.1 transposase [Rhodovastum atsumiense]CAH2603518.1 transposase [Rhodovastum atsumiense]
MTKNRSFSIAFKRQVVQEYLAGENLNRIARRHGIARNLLAIWVDKFAAGAFDDPARELHLLPAYKERIAALERMVGRQALEIEKLRDKLGNTRPAAAVPANLGTISAPWNRTALERRLGQQALEIESLRQALDGSGEARSDAAPMPSACLPVRPLDTTP